MPTQPGSTRGRFEELSEQECQELLAARGVGRIGFTGPGGPAILPVNFVLHGRDIVFRTAPYNLIATSVRGQRVAFEIDEFDEYLQSGWSVLAVGTARFDDEDELPLDRFTKPEPWAAGSRPLYVRIADATLTGRRVYAA